MLRKFYATWMNRWETGLANVDRNRVERPLEWGLDWLGLDAVSVDPDRLVGEYSRDHVARSECFFRPESCPSYTLRGSTLRFSSSLAGPHAANNTVEAEFFRARNHQGRAVVVIPQWNSDFASHLALCRLLEKAGISALRMSPAYHHARMPPELQRADYHVSANIGRTIHATRQSVLDARCCLDWLEREGYHRLGMLGSSLGSCITLLAVAHDERVTAAVFNHVSMYFSDVVWTGMSCRHIRKSLDGRIAPDQLRQYWSVISPASYLGRLEGRRLQSLLIWAAHDTTFLPEYSRQVLDGFSKRELKYSTVRLPCGHYTSGRFPFNLMEAWVMVRYFLKHL